jgi:hypothetical protein
MPLATRTELLEIVPELRAMAAQSKTTTVRETLNLLANRYAALAAGATDPTPRLGADRGTVSVSPSGHIRRRTRKHAGTLLGV